MKKHLLSLLCLAPAFTHAQAPIPYVIKGKIGNLNAPAKIYLVQGFQATDSATFKNGAFEFKGTTDVPQSATLLIKRDGRFGQGVMGMNDDTRVYLEPGPVVLLSPDSLRKATVKGGPITRDDQKLQASLKPLVAKIQALGAEGSKLTAEQQKDPAFIEPLKNKFEAVAKEYARQYKAFIKANPSSWVSLDALSMMGQMELPQYAEVAPLYNALSPELRNSPQGRKYGELVQGLKDVAIGQPAPAFSQKTPDGKTVSLTDYRGKYVLVDFWASWCGPCRAENPAVTKAYNEFKSRNFEILGVSLDRENDREKWLKAIQDDKLTWTQVSDLQGWQNEVAQRYHVRSIPQNFLVDPSGKIIAANLRGEELKATLARFIK